MVLRVVSSFSQALNHHDNANDTRVSPPERQKQKQKQPQQVRFVVVVVVSLFLTCLCLLIPPPLQPKDNSKPTTALVTAAAKSYRKTAKRRATIS